MSYRRGWQLVWSVNTSFRVPVVATATGAVAVGARESRCYRAFEHDVQTRALRAFKAISDKARRGARSPRAAPILRLGGRPGARRPRVRLRSRQRYSEQQEVS